MMRSDSPSRADAVALLEKPDDDSTSGSFVAMLRNAFGDLSFGKIAGSTLEALKPEILNRRRHGTRRPIGPTAWLDGLRGWAAFIVCFVHMSVYTHEKMESCYAYPAPADPNATRVSPASWPVLRFFFSGGHLAVMLFFTISGYVLTRKLIQLLHEERRDDFLEHVNSSMIRRPVRLFFPVACSTLAFAVFYHLTGVYISWPKLQSNIFAEIWNWILDMLNFAYFFRNGFLFSGYNMHTWTIPVELRGSLFVFVWLFATHRISHRARILMTLGMALYLAIGTTGAWYAAFFAGMFTVELDLLASDSNTISVKLPWDNFRKYLNRNSFVRKCLTHSILFAGLYLGGEPSGDNQSKQEILGTCPGWVTLSHLIPPVYDDKLGDKLSRWYWLFWAAWMLLVAIKEIDWARRLFEAPFSQYLGKVSFSLYLIHGPMIFMFSNRLFYMTGVKKPMYPDEQEHYGSYYNKWHDASWWPFADGGPPGLEPNFLFCALLSIPLFLYVAELGTRLWDGPSVNVARWVYSKLRSL